MGYLSIRNAAWRTGIAEERLRKAILEGRLVALPLDDDRHYFVQLSDVMSEFPDSVQTVEPFDPAPVPVPRSSWLWSRGIWGMILLEVLLIAILLLVHLGASPGRAGHIDRCLKGLASDDPKLRSWSQTELLRLGEAAVPKLVEAFQSGDPILHERCREILSFQVFEPGARYFVRWRQVDPEARSDPETMKTYEELAANGRISRIVDHDHLWLTSVWEGILSDRPEVASASLRALHEIIQKRGLDLGAYTDLASSPTLQMFHDPEARAKEFMFWTTEWFTAQNRRFVKSWSDR